MESGTLTNKEYLERDNIMGKEREIHGNKAKVDPGSNKVPEYLTNTVTMSDRKKHETPVVDDDNVAYARKFVEENKK